MRQEKKPGGLKYDMWNIFRFDANAQMCLKHLKLPPSQGVQNEKCFSATEVVIVSPSAVNAKRRRVVVALLDDNGGLLQFTLTTVSRQQLPEGNHICLANLTDITRFTTTVQHFYGSHII